MSIPRDYPHITSLTRVKRLITGPAALADIKSFFLLLRADLNYISETIFSLSDLPGMIKGLEEALESLRTDKPHVSKDAEAMILSTIQDLKGRLHAVSEGEKRFDRVVADATAAGEKGFTRVLPKVGPGRLSD